MNYSIMTLLLIFSFLSKAQTSTLTLENCIEKAIENNIQIKRSKLNHDNARVNALQSKAQLLPTINASANHSYNFGRNINPVTNTFQENNIQGNQFSISAGLPIFNGFQTQLKIKEAKSNYMATDEEIKNSKNEITLAVISAYLQVLFGEEQLKAAQWQLQNSVSKSTLMQKSFDAGIVSKNQLLEMQALQATDELNIISCENNLELAKLTLIQLMLLPADTELNLSPETVEPKEENDVYQTDEIYAYAIQTLPAPKQAKMLIESAKYSEMSAKNSRLPRLSLWGSIFSNYAQILGQENTFTFPEQMRNNLGQYVQLKLDVPIFNAWQSKSWVQNAIVKRKNAEINAIEINNSLRQEIEKAQLNKTLALKKYTAFQKQIDLLTENFRMAEQKLAVGSISLNDFGMAKNKLSAAESDFIRTKYDYIFKSKILAFYKSN